MIKRQNSGHNIDVESPDSLRNGEQQSFLPSSASTSASSATATATATATSSNEDNTKGGKSGASKSALAQSVSVVSRRGLQVLILLAVQNCSKNLLMRYVMKDQPNFLTSAAVIGVEAIKLILCTTYILLVDKASLASIFIFLKQDWRNSVLLGVPAAAYSFQMSLEYVALANLNAAMFSVLVQCKLLFTAIFAAIVLQKKLKYIQVLSLILLTTGVMLCNLQKLMMATSSSSSSTGRNLLEEDNGNTIKGILATLGIAVSSGFASVYTEKVIKAKRKPTAEMMQLQQQQQQQYSLAYMQVQLALVSLIIVGFYAMVMDFSVIVEYGLWHNFTTGAFVSVFNSAIGGLIVAAVLKFADSVLKGYATAISVVMTGVLSRILFGTQLSVMYSLGLTNVFVAVLLYNGRKETLDKYVC